MTSRVIELDRPARRRRRRWPFALAGVVLPLALVAAALRFIWLPNWRPSLHRGESYGIDVSAHQKTIDWTRVANDNIRFAYIKATEGGDFTDDHFDENWRGTQAAGLDRGAYHFFALCSPGALQAEHFLKVVPPDATALPPAVDLELAGNCSQRPDADMFVKELGSFLQRVEQAWGRQVVLYVGDDFNDRYPVPERLKRPLWRYRFLFHPDVNGWVIWQVDGYAHVDGISGNVDLDVMRTESGRGRGG
jgi:lysozyme